MLRRDLILIALIAAAAFGIRTYPAWNGVFDARGIGFLETDAWYHVRLAENQVRNYPWRVTVDPYAAPGGQFVPVAPLFDTITSTAVVLIHGRDASTGQVERVAAFMPPILGALTVVAIWALGSLAFDRRAGLLGAALAAILPGHFLDRTMLGFVDHHALEALLAIVTLLAIVWSIAKASIARASVAGIALGLYLLAWASGAFLVAIIAAWLVLFAVAARTDDQLRAAASTAAVAALVALALVVAFQDARMYRYGSQVIALAGLAAISGAVGALIGRRGSIPRGRVLAAIALTVVLAIALAFATARDSVLQLLTDVGRLTPDPARMGVLEARPLFLYAGEWRWSQPWAFFRTGFFIALAAFVPLTIRVWRQRGASDLLVLVFAAATLVATIGQNRFGYYFVTAAALVGGWLATVILDWGGVPHARARASAAPARMPFARDAAVVVVAGAMFAPNLAPGLLLAPRSSNFPAYWRNAMEWIGGQTPPPFLQAAGKGDEYYYARYSRDQPAVADYSVMDWWDHGYWIIQTARRVPVSNPTQERASTAGRFYSETDEARALALLRETRSRYVLADWELPFRQLAGGTIMGRFQNVVDWAGGVHASYYEILYRLDDGDWTPVWIFHEPYYRSMAFQLAVLGGKGARPDGATSVITTSERVDANGLRFRELLSEQTYPTFEAAQRAAALAPAAAQVVGFDPWRSAFPVEPLQSLVERYAARTPAQKATETPYVRVFEVR